MNKSKSKAFNPLKKLAAAFLTIALALITITPALSASINTDGNGTISSNIAVNEDELYLEEQELRHIELLENLHSTEVFAPNTWYHLERVDASSVLVNINQGTREFANNRANIAAEITGITGFNDGFGNAANLFNSQHIIPVAGAQHSFALLPDGSLWAWGFNNGRLGDGTTTRRHTPVWIMDDVVQVSGNSLFTMAIRSDNSLWAWGNNSGGRFGIGTTTSLSLVPIRIMDDVVYVSVGSFHTMAIRSDGSLWAWGGNVHGQLGDGTTIDRTTPVMVMDNVISVSAGVFHTAAIRGDGSLWAWGSNGSGNLGDGTATTRHAPVWIMDDVVQVSAAFFHTTAIRSDGSLWAWGSNAGGRLGDGTTTGRRTPTKIMDDTIYVSAGIDHTMAIRNDGSLWAWGSNADGRLGDGTTQNSNVPTKVTSNVTLVSTSGGSSNSGHTMAVTSDGSLWAWGLNNNGQLGDGTIINRYIPVLIMEAPEPIMPPTIPVTGITINQSNFTLQISREIESSQNNLESQGVLNIHSLRTTQTPHPISKQLTTTINPTTATNTNVTWSSSNISVATINNQGLVTAISPGTATITVTTEDGGHTDSITVTVINAPTEGGPPNRPTPEGRNNLLSAGYAHSAILLPNGTLWTWGNNNYGQLGNGTTNNSDTPIMVLDDVIYVSTGHSHTMAIRSDGSLWAWGSNIHGQLGDGTTVDRHIPVKIAAIEDIIFVSAGGSHTIAILSDGSLWAWGNNADGRLGDGTTTNRLTPVMVMEGVLDASAGHFMSLVVRE